MSSDKNYIPISVTTGAIIGTVHGFRNPSEAVCKKLAQTKPSLTETMKNYADCFDMKTAAQKVRTGELRLDEYQKTNNVYSAIYDVYEKEKQIIDVMETPIEERTMTFRQAIKEANKARPELWKAMFSLNKEFKQKLIDLGVFDAEKFSQTLKSAARKTALSYKELSKGAFKGLGIGAVIGTGIGLFLNHISK